MQLLKPRLDVCGLSFFLNQAGIFHAVFSNPKYIKLEDVPKELPNLTRFLRDRACMTVRVFDYDKATKTVGNGLATMIILIQGTSNQIITMKKLSGGYKDDDFMTQLNPVLAKVN